MTTCYFGYKITNNADDVSGDPFQGTINGVASIKVTAGSANEIIKLLRLELYGHLKKTQTYPKYGCLDIDLENI